MLTKVTAYSQWTGVDPLVLNVIDRPETDQFEMRNIDGLGPVKAAVNTTPLGSIKGSSFSGTSVAERNLVFTLGLDPDWDTWTVSKLRRLLDKFFMPEQSIRFVFETMEFSPVEISGYVESNEPNIFSKDPEQQISVICPSPDFVSVAPIQINGFTDGDPVEIDYQGNVETGISVTVDHSPTGNAEIVTIHSGEVNFVVDAIVNPNNYMAMQSIPGSKYVRNYTFPGNVQTNLLNNVYPGSEWIKLYPGVQEFYVLVNNGTSPWKLTYFERFGSL